jgi:hypothetical protein
MIKKYGIKIIVISGTLLALPAIVLYAQYTGQAPVVSNVEITEVSDSKVVIEWETNIETDSTVNYGLNEYHGIMRDPLPNKKKHKIEIDKLEPSTTYHFRVVSSDAGGNKTASGGFVFTTGGIKKIPGIEEVAKEGGEKEKALVEKVFYALEQISTPGAIELIADKVQEVAKKILVPPLIIGAPKVVAETDSAKIRWVTDRESGTMVYLVPDSEYDENSSDPYTLSQGDPDERVTEHEITIIGLKPASKYHFQVVSEDDTGLQGKSIDDIFQTKSVLPVIRNLRIIKVEETSATLSWSTDLPASGEVEYKNLRNNSTKTAGDPLFAVSHTVKLVDLEFGTKYSVFVKAKNEAGDEVMSDPLAFTTVKDEVAPIISKVTNESTLFPGDEVKIQTLVGWQTDEPSFCQFFYTQGLGRGGAEKGDSLLKETEPTVPHVQVIIGLAPATVYSFWVICDDIYGNSTRSENFVLFTPRKEKSIIDIILENFEATFGWVKNINQ